MADEATNLQASLESKLGGRLTVWIGAVALALGGIFLVKFSIDQGWISPQLRVISGLFVGLGMALAAWKLRERSNYVAQGLAAAAVADVFACIWAAVNLYGMIPPEAGFVIMASTAGAAAVMSRGLGPIVAVVGLLGGFITPVLLPGGDLPWLLFGYFLLLQGGTEVLARKPGQEWLSALGFGAGLLWALAYVVSRGQADSSLWVAAFGTLSALLYGLAGARTGLTRAVIVHCSAALAVILALAAVVLGEHSTGSWLMLGGTTVALGVLARLREEYVPVIWIAGAGALLATIIATNSGVQPAFHLAAGLAVSFGFALASLCAIGSRRPQHWLHAGGLVSTGALAVAFWARWDALPALAGTYGSTVIAALLAATLGMVAMTLARLKREEAWIPAVYANIVLAAAWPLSLDAKWFTLLWAAQLPAIMAQARMLGSKELRVLANVTGVLVFLSFTLNPAMLWYDTLPHPFFNWIIPAFAFAVACMIVTRQIVPDHRLNLRENYATGAALMSLFGMLLVVRHISTGGVMHASFVSTAELAAYGCVGMAFGAILRRAFNGVRSLEETGEAVLVLSTLYYAVGVGIFRCPPMADEPVGAWSVFNMLSVIYLFPVLMAAASLLLLGRRAPRQLGAILVGVVAPLFVAWIGFSIRHAFHGSHFWSGGAAGGEHLAYSLAMAAGAVAMLLWGMRTRHRAWRMAGLAAIGVCTCKVFLFDASGTEGIYRALSFLGLGVSLMGLGYLYNRFVIRDFATAAQLPPLESIVVAGAASRSVPPTGEPAPGSSGAA